MTDTAAGAGADPPSTRTQEPCFADAGFRPPAWCRNPHAQSILPNLRLRRPLLMRHARALLAASVPRVLDCGEGVRLLGHLSTQQAAGRPGVGELAILLHGWEGSADSLHILSLGSRLFDLGCDVFRLNFRDHGSSHHLNEDIFHSCRLDEVIGAVRCIQHELPQQRLTLAGFSLGGNFALRVAVRAPAAAIRLERALAICPVLRPHSTMDVLERGCFVYRRHFINRWKRSLRLKQQCFPGRYDFGPLLTERSIRSMTRALVERYSEFSDLEDYLDGYSLTGDVLACLEVPSHLLYALDDPIIPARDIDLLARSPALHLLPMPQGGHCGFMDGFGRPSWADRRIVRLMNLGLSRQFPDDRFSSK